MNFIVILQIEGLWQIVHEQFEVNYRSYVRLCVH